MIVHAFKENIFPFPKVKTSQYGEWTEEEKGEEYVLPKEKPEITAEKEKGINTELCKNYFKYQSPSHIYISLNDRKHREIKFKQTELKVH